MEAISNKGQGSDRASVGVAASRLPCMAEYEERPDPYLSDHQSGESCTRLTAAQSEDVSSICLLVKITRCYTMNLQRT
ncbi:hypothetical protein GCM10008949_52680 [Deinococcus humi]|nr:hypothetical protein GCM10008949_52680 [Deinococcus humi]